MEELTMPYGATVEGNGSWWPAIVGDHPMKNTSSSLNLVPGPCRIAASWDGENGADVVLTTGGEVKRVAHIPAKNQRGGGLALSWSPSEPGKETESSSTRSPRRAKPAPSRSTQCPPPSCRGGGVGDGTIGNGLDALPGHQAHIVSEFGARTDRRRQGRQRHRDHLLVACGCPSADYRLRREQVDVTLRGVTQAVRHGWSTQRENRPCGDGESRENRHVCLDRDAGQSTTGGCDYLPSPGVLTTAVAGGGGGGR